MPRKARVDALGALHHIIVRGIERARIFKVDTDRNDFLNRIVVAGKGTKPGQGPQSFLLLGVRELGMSMSELSKRLELSLASVSQSVKRGEKIADEGGFCLIDTLDVKDVPMPWSLLIVFKYILCY